MRPVSGRCSTSTSPRRSTTQATSSTSIGSGRSLARGSTFSRPRARARQALATGQRSQAGERGVQTVAPEAHQRLIPLAGALRLRDELARTLPGPTLRRRGGCVVREQRESTRTTLPSTSASGWSKAIESTAPVV